MSKLCKPIADLCCCCSSRAHNADQWGMSVLYTPDLNVAEQQQQLVDIVAVHGLMGHQFGTWTHKETHRLWIKDFLPKSIPYARVMTFGYDANIRSATTAGITETAQTLLRAITAKRQKAETRRLILIGHSLGGLVIKRMLLLAFLNKDPIFKACYGIVFMAVPHSGADIANFATTLVTAARPVFTVATTFISDLQRDSKELNLLSTEFRQIQNRFYYLCVQETNTTRLGIFKRGLVVSCSSATLGLPDARETVYPLAGRNHFEVCKFASEESSGFTEIMGGLVKLCERAVKPPLQNRKFRNRHFVVPNLLSSRFRGRDAELEVIRKAFRGPADEIRRAALWGIGGIGKSQLAYRYAESEKANYHAVFFVNASTLAAAASSFNEIHVALGLPRRTGEDPATKIAEVITWLNRNSRWLLIFDNVQEDSYTSLCTKFLPMSKCRVLITTRSATTAHDFAGKFRDGVVQVPVMDMASATGLVLDAAELAESALDDVKLREAAAQVAMKLGYLPVALDFVGRVTRSLNGLVDRSTALSDIKKRRDFFKNREGQFVNYNSSQCTFAMLYGEFAGRLSKEICRPIWDLTAFLSPSWISAAVFVTACTETKDSLIRLTASREKVKSALSEIHNHGLSTAIEQTEDYQIHDFVHEVNRSTLSDAQNQECSDSAARCLLASFPEYRMFDKWEPGRKFLDHALWCISWARELRLRSTTLARLQYQTSKYARFTGQYELAENLAQDSLDNLQGGQLRDSTDQDILQAFDSLGCALRRQSKWEECERAFHDSIALNNRLEQSIESFTTILALDLAGKTRLLKDLYFTALNELGWMYFLRGNPTEALLYLQQAQKGRLEVFGTNYGPLHHTNQNLAACYAQLGDFEIAEELYLAALRDHEKRFTKRHIWVMHIKHNLAQLYAKRGKLTEAIENELDVLETRRELLGHVHPDVLATARSLVDMYIKADRVSEANQLKERTIDDCRKEFGDDDETTLDITDSLCVTDAGPHTPPPESSSKAGS